MTSKIVQDLDFSHVKTVVENHSMAILLPTCEGCCEVQSFFYRQQACKSCRYLYTYKKFSYMKAIIHDKGVFSITGL